MSWNFSRFFGQKEPTSADIATERLHVLLVTSEGARLNSRLTAQRLEEMKLEIAQVIGRYVGAVQSDDIKIEQRKEDNMDVLEMSVSLNDVKE